ncbi:MAG TPA: glutamine--fructose-6-phosphate transaminase (isomerizing) [Anaerolineaceae bacterium]|jgi:glucosamine--fructose-6-phosphate aminotransferase (isomerizing)|nr:glutamine--fructose-6-phosphate transaminase (isomerizing) [Anaerolineaceae bacterium]HOQ70080.1 glutamine--fructose-6-phosphate transaminase (isomerizing) [Anaerolineaceae bacterium]HPD63497.1 glutamine--fructose-6-phosphate transaminase (isomerizing) [Anaerolineaceae bacterium]HQF69423.1 glutamine--fructose-6-phosphate transaminase (isomerizing) [Anaerolineaceae bacterium]HQK05636.1 glutamine--fructose-6-phosphate transaminase (isomerizing) [Anaerolineaceae bacterium]
MCGIVGYIGERDATPLILGGLKKLEYRGYDSAGLAVLKNGQIEVRRNAGKLVNLEMNVCEQPISGTLGIGHTRWATHGEPSARNAHPHLSGSGEVVVVHNGIVENFIELKEELVTEGVVFQSDTDTETIVHLIEKFLSVTGDLESAARKALGQLKGAHGIVVFTSREPDKIIAARIGNAGGVVIGLGEGENFIASDIPAILEHTRKLIFLESRQMAVVTREDVHISTIEGTVIHPQVSSVAWDPVSAEKGEYRHFMQKEIHEQVRSLTDTLAGRVNFKEGTIRLPQLNLTVEKAKEVEKIVLTACGTASHAGMVGRILIERIAGIPAALEIASEFRYSDPIVNDKTILIAISQSGETADTLAAMEEGRRKGATIWSIVNAIGSQAMRVADGSISMQTGPEIGVASTKAFTAPLVDLYMLAILLADLRGDLSVQERKKLVEDLRLIPELAGRCLDREGEVEETAYLLRESKDMLYLGRGINMPIAYEGALKLKEISYIHAEAYPAGEMKHGPIALIDENMPVVAIAIKDPWYEKMISQIEQAKARGGIVVAVATEGDERVAALVDRVLWVPEAPWMLSPVLTSIPLQMLAYHIATMRGLDVDQPRNLAKSVTVE